MPEFNSMTIVAALNVIEDAYTHSDFDVLAVEWGIDDRVAGSSKAARVAMFAKIALDEDIQVHTEIGVISMARALMHIAMEASPYTRRQPAWQKLKAGLKLDGFEIELPQPPDPKFSWMRDETPPEPAKIVRMLPSEIPGLGSGEAKNEVSALLTKHDFSVPMGHLEQAVTAFQRGDWASSNAGLRSFFEGYLSEIAKRLGCPDTSKFGVVLHFLGGVATPPFFISGYNEWISDNNKHQYVQGLMTRMHPHGSHPGLSEEEDATFRMQAMLITARLFLRRYDQRTARR